MFLNFIKKSFKKKMSRNSHSYIQIHQRKYIFFLCFFLCCILISGLCGSIIEADNSLSPDLVYKDGVNAFKTSHYKVKYVEWDHKTHDPLSRESGFYFIDFLSNIYFESSSSLYILILI